MDRAARELYGGDCARGVPLHRAGREPVPGDRRRPRGAMDAQLIRALRRLSGIRAQYRLDDQVLLAVRACRMGKGRARVLPFRVGAQRSPVVLVKLETAVG